MAVSDMQAGATAGEIEQGLRLDGRFCELAPVDAARDTGPLLDAFRGDPGMFTYLPMEPVGTVSEMGALLARLLALPRTFVFFTVIDRASGAPVGLISFLRINPRRRSIEIGYVTFSRLMRRTRLGTEAVYLLLKAAFDRGYERVEWKCDALNAKSLAAAVRYGFRFEGLWRRALIYKGRSRCTAWLGMTRHEWTASGLREAFELWLDNRNFDPTSGQQRKRLDEFQGAVLASEPRPDLSEVQAGAVMNPLGQPVGPDVDPARLPEGPLGLDSNVARAYRPESDLAALFLAVGHEPWADGVPFATEAELDSYLRWLVQAGSAVRVVSGEGAQQVAGWVALVPTASSVGSIEVQQLALDDGAALRFLNSLVAVAKAGRYRRVGAEVRASRGSLISQLESLGWVREARFRFGRETGNDVDNLSDIVCMRCDIQPMLRQQQHSGGHN